MKRHKDIFHKYKMEEFSVGDKVELDVGSLYPLRATIKKINKDSVVLQYPDPTRTETFSKNEFEGCYPSPI